MSICLANLSQSDLASSAYLLGNSDSSLGGGLRISGDGFVEVIPKSPAYVAGELIRASFDRVSSIISGIFSKVSTNDTEDPSSNPDSEPLQAKIDSLGWKEKLTVATPRPSRSYPIKEREAENWINAQICEKQRKAARALIEGTRHISQAEFEEALAKSVEKFNSWLEAQESKDYVLIVSPKGISNRWVAELALPHLKTLPKQVIKYHKHSPFPSDLVEYYQKHPDTTKIVFFDDAAYSCIQSGEMIQKLNKLNCISQIGEDDCFDYRENYGETPKNYSITAVIPFMSDFNCLSRLYEETIAQGAEDNVNVFSSQKMPSVADVLTPEQSSIVHCPQEKSPVYFDHKLPDFVSTCSDVFEEKRVAYGFDSRKRKYCEEDWGPESTTGQCLYDMIIRGYSERERKARLSYDQRVKASENLNPMDLQFIDPIHPPYKEKDEA